MAINLNARGKMCLVGDRLHIGIQINRVKNQMDTKSGKGHEYLTIILYMDTKIPTIF